MIDWLQPDLTTLAFCWRLARCDGVTIGLTSHDRDLEFGGLIYRATPGMVPSAIEMRDGFEASTTELRGMLTSNALRADDLKAARWDGALLTLYGVNWEAPDDAPLLLIHGCFGATEQQGDGFSVELRGALSQLDQEVTIATSPMCRARLGDQACRVDLAGRVVRGGVLNVNGTQVTLGVSTPGNVFARGSLRWLDGRNAGLTTGILAHDGADLILAEPPAFLPEPNAPVLLTQGCDGRFATCRDRFANSVNFRGEPHLPGNDALTRYVS